MTKLQRLKKEAFKDPAVQREYDALSDEFTLIDELLSMRSKAGLTQDQIAKRMGTSKSSISRMEGGKGNPSWDTLQRYAHACGQRVTLRAV